jgi:hypothetical protein
MFRINRRFQQRAIAALCHVPPDINCPCCHHHFDIVVSRQQISRGALARKFWRYYRCRVCDHRFSTFNHDLLSTSFRLAIPLLAFVAIGLWMVRF